MTISRELVDAADVGIDPARVEILLRRARLEVEHGPLPSAQVAVAGGGRLVAFEACGDATLDSRYILQSVGRTVVAGAVWKLLGEGVLGLDERVADVIPEFATNGKEVVTVHQVLTHTAGFPFAPLGYPKMLHRADRLDAMAKWRLTYEPGTQLQFHLTSAAWVIAELVERRTGLPFDEYLRTADRRAAWSRVRAPRPGGSIRRGRDRTGRHRPDQRRPTGRPLGPVVPGQPRVLAGGEPSHSIVGSRRRRRACSSRLSSTPASGDPRLSPREPAIHVSMRPAGDKFYGGSDRNTNMGLFVTVSGNEHDDWLPSTGSPRTFGNGGAPCQLGYMDPDTGVSFAFLTNGYPMAGLRLLPARQEPYDQPGQPGQRPCRLTQPKRATT